MANPKTRILVGGDMTRLAPTVRSKQTKYGARKGMTPKGIINRTKGAS